MSISKLPTTPAAHKDTQRLNFVAHVASLQRAADEREADHKAIVHLRMALNRIAYPETYGTAGMEPKEIARRALVIGMTVDPLPAVRNLKAQPK